MITLLTCNGYVSIRHIPCDADVPVECQVEELRRMDGYAVVASLDGQIIANAEGYRDNQDTPEERLYRDAIDRVCGYLND